MTCDQAALYEKICSFSLDAAESSLMFSQRLAQENDWNYAYALQVIEEYKKFVFLALVAGHPVTPSEQVDQVWHLHLTYTHSYWQEFCPNILGAPFHHSPTHGGVAEQVKFVEWYNRTLTSYQHFFGEVPPLTIWPVSDIRFGKAVYYKRINTHKNWILPKPELKQWIKTKSGLAILIFFAISVVSCQVFADITNSLNFIGSDFRPFYILLYVIGLMVACGARVILCSTNNNGFSLVKSADQLSDYEVAYLAGGTNRVLGTAMIYLLQHKYLKIVAVSSESAHAPESSWWVKVIKPEFHECHPIEQAVMQATNTPGFENSLDKVIGRSYLRLKKEKILLNNCFQTKGIFLNDKQASDARFYPLAIICLLMGGGLVNIFVDLLRQKPVEFLCISIAFLLPFAFRLYFKPTHSQYGKAILKYLTRSKKPLKKTVDATQLPLAYALFGVTALEMNSAFDDIYKIFNATLPLSGNYKSDGSGEGGCSGGCGGH